MKAKVVVTKHKAVPNYWYQKSIRIFQTVKVDETTKDKNQKPKAIIYVLLKVTTCLYLSPSNKARSLSTLIAVEVDKDTAHKVEAQKPIAKLV